MGLSKHRLGKLIAISEIKNSELTYNLENLKGISVQKIFIQSKADMTNVSLSPYLVVGKNNFAYVPTTSRNSNKITLAYNNTDDVYIVSSSYIVFGVCYTRILIPDFLFMYFNRPEFDRYARFNSWGSARETFSWQDMCDIEIPLPSIEIQQKYVDIYKAMKANQEVYEKGLDDLKSINNLILEKIKKTAQKTRIGTLITEKDLRNSDGKISKVHGINIEKQFINSVANTTSTDLTKYKLVKKNQFAYSAMQTGRDECIRIALYHGESPIIISPAYSVLEVNSEDVLAEYIMLWFSRKESDRYGWFISDSSVRASLELERFYDIEIPLPSKVEQESIVTFYHALQSLHNNNEKLKQQIKDMCPILIKGALEEARKI